ncbi:hypothetical protein VKT23_008431 [Stygiomarasmius scandens]|uniref:Ribonuclease H1 N-terminal domain-containing protein n=1 Tax=Marasmiellus scandens TaxID=2682957 RepID=A0ABR1JGE9_9AGAR
MSVPSRLSSSSCDSLWDQLEDLGPYMAAMSLSEDPNRATCRPQLFDSRTKSGNGQPKPKAWYLVYNGTNPGCYTTWADTSARVMGVKGARHESFSSYDKAVHAWRQNCLAKHSHSPGFVDGTVWPAPVPERDETATNPLPRACTPPPHNVPFTYESTSAPQTPQTRRTVSRTPAASPSSSSATHPSPRSSPMKKQAAKAYFGSDSPPVAANAIPQRRWAVSAGGYNGVFDAPSADAIRTEADRRGLPVFMRQVETVVEADDWFERMENASEMESQYSTRN